MKTLLKIAKGKKSQKINLTGGSLGNTLFDAASEGIICRPEKITINKRDESESSNEIISKKS